MSVIVKLVGKQIFCDLVEAGAPKSHPNNLRYGSTIVFPKGTPQDKVLFDAVAEVCRQTWPKEWEERLEKIQGAIENGIEPRFSPINILDGDLHNPEYNSGCWQVSARRNANAGRPITLTEDGEVCYKGDQLVVDLAEVPKRFDAVLLGFEVWASKDNDRVNFKLEVVRRLGASPSLGAQPPNPQLAAEIASAPVEELAGGLLETLLIESGDEPEVIQPKKKSGRTSLFS